MMSTASQIAATVTLENRRSSLDRVLHTFQERLNALPPEEVEAIIKAAIDALTPVNAPTDPFVIELLGGRTFTPEQRVANKVELLMRQFAWRRELLADALTASMVAKILGTTRQTPHDRVKSGTLLAVMDRGALRFPAWQFEPTGEDGVIAGLPDVVRALDVSPLAKVDWLTRPNDMLDGVAPLELLKSGEIERVVRLARAVGAW